MGDFSDLRLYLQEKVCWKYVGKVASKPTFWYSYASKKTEGRALGKLQTILIRKLARNYLLNGANPSFLKVTAINVKTFFAFVPLCGRKIVFYVEMKSPPLPLREGAQKFSAWNIKICPIRRLFSKTQGPTTNTEATTCNPFMAIFRFI